MTKKGLGRMRPLTENECRIISDLLEMASEEFGNHGCNDYTIPNTPENYEMISKIIQRNGAGLSKEEMKPDVGDTGKRILTEDWMLMDYFAKLLSGEIE
jgi:hypothetical protein